MNSGKHLISTLSQLNKNHAPTKPLFTLQHASSNSHHRRNNHRGHGVSSICFISSRTEHHSHEDTVVEEEEEEESATECSVALKKTETNDDESSSFETDKSESESESESESDQEDCEGLSWNQVNLNSRVSKSRPTSLQPLSFFSSFDNSQRHASTLDVHACLSMENVQLASTHVNGCAYIWDLTKRRVVQTLQDDGTVGVGPGLSIGLLPAAGCSSRRRLFHQRRDDMGTIFIYDQEYNVPVQKIQCLSKTFCHAKASSTHEHILLTPSEHGSFAQLWDLRMESNDGCKSLGLIHGAKLDKYDTRWNEEGMLTSLGLCDAHGGDWVVMGCGMESGQVFFHDLRMMGKNPKSIMMNEDHNMCSVALGKDPILCLDMVPSHNENCYSTTSDGSNNMDWKWKNKESHQNYIPQRSSVIAIAGLAADAAEQLALDEKDRGTVAVMKATTSRENMSLKNDGKMDVVKTGMKARIRAKVGTCQLSSDDISRDAKPGVGICKFRPDGKIFAVGGWDKRIRLYSRTSAKMLTVLRGSNSNEGSSISALDWIPNSSDGGDDGGGYILAAGSNDGKISIWRPPRF